MNFLARMLGALLGGSAPTLKGPGRYPLPVPEKHQLKARTRRIEQQRRLELKDLDRLYIHQDKPGYVPMSEEAYLRHRLWVDNHFNEQLERARKDYEGHKFPPRRDDWLRKAMANHGFTRINRAAEAKS